jgi:glycosyltransferase involved in cell wall biosynthesis
MIGHAARSARHIITVSEHSRDDLVALAGADPAKITVVHNGITRDAQPMHPVQARAAVRELLGWDGPFLLTVANTRMPHKNLPRLVEAFARAAGEVDAGLRLVIVGGEPPAALQQAVARSLGPRAEQVVFPGYLERAGLLALYNACRAFVWPSLYEGFGFPPLEAMACGSPVVSSAASVMPEVLGEAAHYFNPTDPADMARAIREVLTDAGLRDRLVQRGTRQAAQFTWAEAARKTAAVYRDVLGL